VAVASFRPVLEATALEKLLQPEELSSKVVRLVSLADPGYADSTKHGWYRTNTRSAAKIFWEAEEHSMAE